MRPSFECLVWLHVVTTGSGANSALLTDIMNRLDEPDEGQDAQCDEDSEDGGSTLQIHLYPAECNNVANTMKALVTGFVDRRGEPSPRRGGAVD